MINGAHLLLYSTAPESDQQVLRAVLEPGSVPAEEALLILALPPAEIATHVGTGTFCQSHCGRDLAGIVLYLMCDILPSTVEALQARKVRCTAIEDTEFGLKT